MAGSSEIVVDESTVVKVADLANLQLSESDTLVFQTQLSRVLRYASDLNELDAIPPSSDKSVKFAFESAELEREDQSTASLAPDLALRNATRTEGTAFTVPRVID